VPILFGRTFNRSYSSVNKTYKEKDEQ